MRRLAALGIVLVGLCSGQMCGVAPQAAITGADTSDDAEQVLPPRQNSSQSAPLCDRVFRNELYGFGVNPPIGADGPYSNPQNTVKLFWAEWDDTTGRRYVVNVSNIGSYTLADAVQANRDMVRQGGGAITEDRACSFSSGEWGWLIASSWPTGTSLDAFQYRAGYLFNVAVFPTTGATAAEVQSISSFVSSLCVDP